ncbi:MAG: hypothetical protein RIR18_1732 [Pseudomonadota bacterium]
MPDLPGFATVCLTLFVVGLLGGGHCVGMCGGIVSALSLSAANPRSTTEKSSSKTLGLHLAYNAGRILSYVLAGALVGALGAASLHLVKDQWLLRMVLFAFANLMLLALGLYLFGLPRFLAPLERGGQVLWRHIQPLTRRWLPVKGFAQAFPLGLLWGWLPCGLVYSALVTALTTGSAVRGGVVMLCFGLGTLPNLLLAGLLAAHLRDFMRKTWVRRLAGGIVISFSLYGFLGVWHLAQNLAQNTAS